jgi:fumarate reductase subunit C
MSDQPAYTQYHPRWYRPRMSTYWWLHRGSYQAFILRELSSVFICWFVVYLLFLIHAVSAGPDAYKEFLAWSKNPVVFAVNLVTLCLVIFHAVTWFNLAPQALVVYMGGRRIPGSWIAASNFIAWALVSALVGWLVLGG